MAPTAQEAHVIKFSIQYASLALLYYDYSLTWTREVKYFWRKKFTLSTALYIACRYPLVANVIYIFAISNKLGDLSCDAAYQLCSALSIIGRAAILTAWGARTYAVFNGNKWVLAFFGSLGLTVLVFGVWHVPNVVCSGSKGDKIVTDLLAILTVVYEVFSVAFTTLRSYQALQVRANGGLHTQREGLTYLVLEQGILYFFAVTSFTAAAMILQMTAPPSSFMGKLINALSLPISGIMTARFLLQLREWEHQATDATEISRRGSEFVINFKIPTVHDDNDDDEDENGHFDRGQPWTIYKEFGNDPVLEARMGHVANVEENMSEVETRSLSTRLAHREREVCVASSSTSMHESRV